MRRRLSNPTWTQSTSGCSVNFSRVALAPNNCGFTTITWNNSTGKLTHAEVEYNTNKSYPTSGSSGGCNFHWTTLHEFGHSQGLRHSKVSTAVMYKFNNGAGSYQPDDKSSISCSYQSPTNPWCINNSDPA